MTKPTVSIVIGFIVVMAVAIGGYFYPKQHSVVGAVSPSGVFNTQKQFSSVSTALSTIAGTSTSILNNGASDRAVTGGSVFCTGVGTSQTYLTGAPLATWSIQIATTTTTGNGLQGNVNYIQNALVIATSSPWAYSSFLASTSAALNIDWPTGSYETILFNATNTAACTVELDWYAL